MSEASASLQFVQEDPFEHERSRKKRARIVTSCDHCRRKRVKCTPITGSMTCEACTEGHIECIWADRQNYITQREARTKAKSTRGVGKQTRRKKEWSSLHIVAGLKGQPGAGTDHGVSGTSKFRVRSSSYESPPEGSAEPPTPNSAGSTSASFMTALDSSPTSSGAPSPNGTATIHVIRTAPLNASTSVKHQVPAHPASIAPLTSFDVANSSFSRSIESKNNNRSLKNSVASSSLGLGASSSQSQSFDFSACSSALGQHAQSSSSILAEVPVISQFSAASHTSPTFSKSSSQASSPSGHTLIPSPYGPPPTQHRPSQRPTSPFLSEDIHYPLFDPKREQYPHPALLQHCIDLLDGLGSQWRGLDKQDIERRADEQTLPPILANGLAALAARYSDRPELRSGKRYSAGDAYCEKAKELVLHEGQGIAPSLDNLYGLLFISWSEYGSGRRDEFFYYGQLAVRMLQKLDGPDAPHAITAWTEEQQLRLNLTWFATARLESCTSWLTGRPMVLEQAHSKWVTKTPLTAATGPITMILEINRQMFEIREMFQAFLRTPDDAGDAELCRMLAVIQARLSDLRHNMHSPIAFTKKNLRFFMEHRRASTFLLVHLVLHMLTIMANCPSIFRELHGILTDRLDISCDSAREIAKIMLIAHELDMGAVIAIPCFDMHIGVATQALMMDTQANRVDRGRRQNTELGLMECANLLSDISGFWKPLDNILHTIQKRPRWIFNSNVDEFFVSTPVASSHRLLQDTQLPPHPGSTQYRTQSDFEDDDDGDDQFLHTPSTFSMPLLPVEASHATGWSAEAHSPESDHGNAMNAVVLRPVVSQLLNIPGGQFMVVNGLPGRVGYERTLQPVAYE